MFSIILGTKFVLMCVAKQWTSTEKYRFYIQNYFRIRISHWQGQLWQHFDSDQQFGSLLSLLLHLMFTTIKKTISARLKNEYIFESPLWNQSDVIKLDGVKAVLSPKRIYPYG